MSRLGRARARACASPGFTLVEVLVTLAVMGLLFAMIGSILTAFLLNEERITKTLARERVGSAVLELLSRDLQGVYAYEIPFAFVGTDEGEEDRLEFLSTRPPAFEVEDEDDEPTGLGGAASEPGGGAFSDDDLAGFAGMGAGRPQPLRLTKIGYFVQPSSQGGDLLTLFRYEAPYEPPAEDPDARQRGGRPKGPFDERPDADDVHVFEVYDRVRRFDLRYFDGEGQWLDGWDEEETVPRAVGVELVIAVPDERPRTGYEDRFDETRRGVYETIIAVPIQLPEPEDERRGR